MAHDEDEVEEEYHTYMISLYPLHIIFFSFVFWSRHVARGIFVPRPGTEPTPPDVEAWSLHHWTTSDIPTHNS